MWIKSWRFIWLKLQFEGSSFLKISFPIPLYIFQELLNCFVDLLTAVNFLIPKVPDSRSASRITVISLKEFILAVMKLLDSITGDDSYNLVDVTTGRMKVLIKIR